MNLSTICPRFDCLKASKRMYWLAQVGLLVLLVTLAFRFSLVTSQGPDEVAHYYFIRFIAHHGHLPTSDTERLQAGYKADLPPVYYLLVGLSARALNLNSPPSIKTNRENLRLNLVTGPKHVAGWRWIKTEDPLRGEVLLWSLSRWLTLLTGLAGIALTFSLARTVARPHPWLGLAATALLSSLPTYVYINSVTNYEPLTGALMAGYLWLLFVTLHRPTALWQYLGLGLLLGLAAATRQTVWPTLIATPLLIICLVYWRRLSWPAALEAAGLFGLGVAVTFGSWLLYLLVYFNDIAELGWFLGILTPIFIGDGSGHTSQQIANVITGGRVGLSDIPRQSESFWQWLTTFYAGIWGKSWLMWAATVLCGLVTVGLVRAWRRGAGRERLWITALLLHLVLLLFFPFLRFFFSGDVDTALARHLLFPAGPIFVALAVWGTAALGQLRPYLTAFMLVLASLYFGISASGIWKQMQTGTDTLPVQTVPLANEPELAVFATMTLIGQELTVTSEILQVALHWRAENLATEDYRFKLTLMDETGTPQTGWLGQPVNARFPTRAWLPGDRVRDEIQLPVAGLPGGNYWLQLQVLDDAGPIPNNQGKTLINLGVVTLSPDPADYTGQLHTGEQTLAYRLWQSNSSSGVPVFEENQTVTFTTEPANAADGLTLALVGPDGVAHPPVDQTGHTHSFSIAPHFANGEYRLQANRLEQETNRVESPPLLRVNTEEREFVVGSITHPLSANFAGYVTLLGYDLPQQYFQPGDAIELTLYWQALRTIGADLILFNHLIGPDGQQWGGRDRRAREMYTTLLWAPGEVISDPYTLQITPDAPPGAYYLLVGLYLPVGQAAVSLPLMEDGRLSQVTHVTIGPIEIGVDDANR